MQFQERLGFRTYHFESQAGPSHSVDEPCGRSTTLSIRGDILKPIPLNEHSPLINIRQHAEDIDRDINIRGLTARASVDDRQVHALVIPPRPNLLPTQRIRIGIAARADGVVDQVRNSHDFVTVARCHAACAQPRVVVRQVSRVGPASPGGEWEVLRPLASGKASCEPDYEDDQREHHQDDDDPVALREAFPSLEQRRLLRRNVAGLRRRDGLASDRRCSCGLHGLEVCFRHGCDICDIKPREMDAAKLAGYLFYGRGLEKTQNTSGSQGRGRR